MGTAHRTVASENVAGLVGQVGLVLKKFGIRWQHSHTWIAGHAEVIGVACWQRVLHLGADGQPQRVGFSASMVRQPHRQRCARPLVNQRVITCIDLKRALRCYARLCACDQDIPSRDLSARSPQQREKPLRHTRADVFDTLNVLRPRFVDRGLLLNFFRHALL